MPTATLPLAPPRPPFRSFSHAQRNLRNCTMDGDAADGGQYEVCVVDTVSGRISGWVGGWIRGRQLSARR